MPQKRWSAAVTRIRSWEPSTLWIVWVVLLLYALPLISAFGALLATDVKQESNAVYVVGTITKEFTGSLRETFGTIVVPLLTAFAIKSIDANGTVPIRTLVIFLGISGLFVISVITSGVLALKDYRDNISAHGPEIYQTLVAATQAYSKELLTYIALAIGISLKKS
jgi:hypothetical protein